jgi:hypothetical protein
MKNKSDSNYLFKTKREWAKYRWEFMRRDPAFTSAYDNLLRLWSLYNDGSVSKEDVNKATKEFSIEFEIPYPIAFIDHKKSFEELVQEKGEDSLTVCFLYRYSGTAVSIVSRYEGEVPKDHLMIDINLSIVNSIDALKKLVNWHVDKYWKECFLPKYPDRSTLIKKTNFDMIIQVGDLKKQMKRISLGKLAKIVFPDDPDGKRKVQQHDARYEELINGGWRMFRYP